jgi:hypothetical protein
MTRSLSVALVTLALGGLQAQPSDKPWVSPQHPAGPSVIESFVETNRYSYTVALYAPPLLVAQPVPKAEARDDTPERAFISRISAMMAGDYEWWLSTWDENGRRVTQERDRKSGNTPDGWRRQWAAIFSGSRMELRKRIVTGEYVVLTYVLRSSEGQQANELELPAVLRQREGRWQSTQDLSSDPLLPASPWISGVNDKDITVR